MVITNVKNLLKTLSNFFWQYKKIFWQYKKITFPSARNFPFRRNFVPVRSATIQRNFCATVPPTATAFQRNFTATFQRKFCCFQAKFCTFMWTYKFGKNILCKIFKEQWLVRNLSTNFISPTHKLCHLVILYPKFITPNAIVPVF